MLICIVRTNEHCTTKLKPILRDVCHAYIYIIFLFEWTFKIDWNDTIAQRSQVGTWGLSWFWRGIIDHTDRGLFTRHETLTACDPNPPLPNREGEFTNGKGRPICIQGLKPLVDEIFGSCWGRCVALYCRPSHPYTLIFSDNHVFGKPFSLVKN